MGTTFQVLAVDEIILVNRRMITTFGGIFIEGNRNLVNPGSLEYVLEECQGSLFGMELYPSVVEKAALICWRIIAGHIFHDGNKRTGLEACRLVLELNGYRFRIDADCIDAALKVASGQLSLTDFIVWLESKTAKLPLSV